MNFSTTVTESLNSTHVGSILHEVVHLPTTWNVIFTSGQPTFGLQPGRRLPSCATSATSQSVLRRGQANHPHVTGARGSRNLEMTGSGRDEHEDDQDHLFSLPTEPCEDRCARHDWIGALTQHVPSVPSTAFRQASLSLLYGPVASDNVGRWAHALCVFRTLSHK